MKGLRQARLGGTNRLIGWLVAPAAETPADARPVLYASLLSGPGVALMAAVAGVSVAIVAVFHTGSAAFWILALAELVLLALRLHTVGLTRRDIRAGMLPPIERSVALTMTWCALQGITAFLVVRTGELSMIVISTALILGMITPICARCYAAPRLAIALVMLCDVPLKIGLALSGRPVLLLMIPLSIPLFVGIRVLLQNYTRMLAASLSAAEHARFLAGHDALTGLANRHGLDDRLAGLAGSPDQPLALFCLDLDRFKPVNDRYGHAAGDAVLVAVAARLRQVAGDAALVARLGGDEFLVAVPDLTPADAQSLAERIEGAVSRQSYAIDGGDRVGIGTSIGYACFPDDATGIAALRIRADAALYAAKRSGGIRRHGAASAIGNAA